jgi:hypothetical protein
MRQSLGWNFSVCVLVMAVFAAPLLSAGGQRERGRRHGNTPRADVSGQVASLSENGFSVESADGSRVSVTTSSRTRFAVSTPALFGEIKKGDIISVRAEQGDNGLVAHSIRILPGDVLELQRRSLSTASDMMFAKVSDVGNDPGNQSLTIQYDDKTQVMKVPEGSRIERISRTDSQALVIGETVRVVGRQNGDNVEAVLVMVRSR